jgi:hypothetical protein
MLAPIVFFVYNRPKHTRQVLHALSGNFLAKESILYIYADGAKDNANDEQKQRVKETRELIKSERWCKEVTIIESDRNMGLAASIINGVTDVVNQYGKVIVLEDDLITSPYFFTYMNDALTLYEDDEQVISIHGYVYPVKKKLPDYFFLKGADCWGWATWKRGWDVFNPDGEYLLNEIKRQNLEKEFNFNNSYDYTGMLQDQIDGKVSSWAIRWYASAFLENKYTLYPGKSFVENIGFDGTGTHCGETKRFKNDLISRYIPITLILVENSKKAKKIFAQYFHSMSEKNSVLKFFKYFYRKIFKLTGINMEVLSI